MTPESSPRPPARASRSQHRRRSAKAGLKPEAHAAKRTARQSVTPTLAYPPELPVSGEREVISQAIRDNQVVVIAGETGSGKTTQLPKMLLDLGYGVEGMIAHTQPRRIAARAVATRLAQETQLELGHGVGYQVRFTSEVDDSTRVKVMTDGILLAELRADPQLRAYDAIIIDEAHERSLNIDFLLGFLVTLLPQRPDLKVIITSATIDPESFARHFHDAPIIRVEGRTFPVEVRYRPLVDDEPGEDTDGDAPAEVAPADQIDGIITAFEELRHEPSGDILVFLSGEREIRDTAEALSAHLQRGGAYAKQWEIVPLFGRLAAGDQQKIFAPHSAPRVVLSTNVAETSLTVPGIVYVIDGGTARISRYSNRTKVQRLPIEPISQASARQRAGRTGRTSPGVVLRLYSEADFDSRPEYTDPEILRTNLASVILQMISLGFAATEDDITAFPFLTPPDARAVRDGRVLLSELGALHTRDGRLQLTKLGRTLSQLPIDPRLARMILAAKDHDCAAEVTAIVAALSIQDVRERPTQRREEADALHARFTDPRSDFLTLLRLWDYLQGQSAALSSSKFRRTCKAEFINFVRVREWQDLVSQLRTMLGRAGVHVPRASRSGSETEPAGQPGASSASGSGASGGDTPRTGRAARAQQAKASYSRGEESIHRALVSGLLSMFGVKAPTGPEYLGARGTRMRIFPGSAVFKTDPDVIVTAELVETSQLWARTCARVDPEWIIDAAGDLVAHQYGEPHWSVKSGSAIAFDRMSLYGVTLIGDKRVGFGTINPAQARELFIRHALIAGEWQRPPAFLRHNARVVAQAEEMASRVRSRRLLASDDVLYAFYDERLPSTITTTVHFDTWWKKTRHSSPDLLNLSVDDLLADDAQLSPDVAADFPLQWELESGGVAKLRYAFDPGSSADGVTVELSPQAAMNADPNVFTWQVPGLRLELITALIRSLPKAKRRYFVPAPDVARDVGQELTPYAGALPQALASALTLRAGGGELTDLVPITIDEADFDTARIPAHLRIGYRIVAGKRRSVIARGENLPALQRELRARDKQRGEGRAAGQAVSPVQQGSSQRPAVKAGGGSGAVDTTPPASFTTVPGLRAWSFGDLPHPITGGGRTVHVGLADAGDSVELRGFDTAGEAARSGVVGTARLIALESTAAYDYVVGQLDNRDKLTLAAASKDSGDVLHDALMGGVLRAMSSQGVATTQESPAPPRTQEQYARLRRGVNDTIVPDFEACLQIALDVQGSASAVRSLVSKSSSLTVLSNLSDVKNQLARLLAPGRAADTSPEFYARFPVYLASARHRVESMGGQAARDRQLMERVARSAAEVHTAALRVLGQDCAQLVERRSIELPAAWQQVLWDIEELRVSLFTPYLPTAHTVSEKRISKALSALSK